MKRNLNRRRFICNTIKGVAGAGILAGASCSGPGNTGLGKSFIHHVFFWLKQPVDGETRAKFEDALGKLKNVETIIDFHLGVPAPTNRDVIDNTYTYSLLTTFADKAGQDIYQDHPLHLQFIEECQELWERVVVYDTVSL